VLNEAREAGGVVVTKFARVDTPVAAATWRIASVAIRVLDRKAPKDTGAMHEGVHQAVDGDAGCAGAHPSLAFGIGPQQQLS